MSIPARLREGPPLLLDGGLGSLLIARGLAAGRAPETWTLERPEEVRAAHAAYVAAGSEAVHTNTFGGNRVRLAAAGLEARVAEVNQAAVALARASGARFVIGDVGPTGEYLPPVGRGDADRWVEVFDEQARALVAAGVDALHVETMSDVREAAAALRALRAAAPGVPVMVSLTFDRRPRGFFTVVGNPLGALADLQREGADAVGANCTLGSADMAALAREASALGLRLVLQPNAGQPERAAGGGVRYAQDAAAFAADVTPLWPAVAALGGCCGTDPSFVAALAAARPR